MGKNPIKFSPLCFHTRSVVDSGAREHPHGLQGAPGMAQVRILYSVHTVVIVHPVLIVHTVVIVHRVAVCDEEDEAGHDPWFSFLQELVFRSGKVHLIIICLYWTSP